MSKDQIDAILESVHSWHQSRQEDPARVLLAMEADGARALTLSDAERAELETLLVESRAGAVADDAEVEAVFAPHRA